MDSIKTTGNEIVEKDKPNKLKFVIITIFIVIPLLIVTLFYFNNKTFKSRVNNLLGKLPGATGEYFRTTPTEKERTEMKEELAYYYMGLEPVIVADKLYIIKKDDEKLYSEIIKLMNSISSSKTEEIIKMVRNLELRKDLLYSIHDEIQSEKESFLMNEVSRLENQDLLITINEIKRRIETDSGFIENLSIIINTMDDEKLVDILYYLDGNSKNKIYLVLNDNKRSSIDNKLLVKEEERTKLEDLAGLYESKPVEIALEEIGNVGNYTIEELVIIYQNLSILKSAEILSKVHEDNFIQELFNSIRKEEQLGGVEESITNDIGKSVQFITEYNKKVDDLVSVYERMTPSKVAKIAEKMMMNNDTVTDLEIGSEPTFEISDASIIADVLSRMGKKTLSGIMNSMNDRKASELTQILAKPINKIAESAITEESKPIESVAEYNKKIDALVIVYENMQPKKAAEVVEKMIENSSAASTITDILSKMQETSLSNIMNNMKEENASKLTQMLVRP